MADTPNDKACEMIPVDLATWKPKIEEHAAMAPVGQPELHIYEEDDGSWAVWINTGVSDFDGLCIATGATRDDAVKEAVQVIEWVESVLQAPRPTLLDRK